MSAGTEHLHRCLLLSLLTAPFVPTWAVFLSIFSFLVLYVQRKELSAVRSVGHVNDQALKSSAI